MVITVETTVAKLEAVKIEDVLLRMLGRLRGSMLDPYKMKLKVSIKLSASVLINI